MMAPPGSLALRSTTVMLSRPRKPPSKTFNPWLSTLLTHHAKLISSLWKHFSRNDRSGSCSSLSFQRIDSPRRPCLHGRIQVREFPFVGGDLSVGVLELLEEQNAEVVLRRPRVDQRKSKTLKRQVPGRKPRIFPFVGHHQYSRRIQMPPTADCGVSCDIPAAGDSDCRRRATDLRRKGRSACSSNT